MDIESKAYRVRSSVGGQVEVTRKGGVPLRVYVSTADLPSVREMAMMHEQRFDRAIGAVVARKLYGEG